jgi:hypothetical protein
MNLGWRAADAEYVFFLHDDTEADPGAAGCDLWPASVIPLGRAALHPAGSEARWHAILTVGAARCPLGCPARMPGPYAPLLTFDI